MADLRKIPAFVKNLIPPYMKTGPALAWAGSFLLSLIVVLLNLNSGPNLGRGLEELEAGRVADNDIISEQSVSYIDEKATNLRIEAQERLVPAVFHYSFRSSADLQGRWKRFAELAGNAEGHSREAYCLLLEAEFPGELSAELLNLLYSSDDRQRIIESGAAVLDVMLERGIYSMPQTGLGHLNPDVIELIRQTPARIEFERVPLRTVTTRSRIADAVETYISGGYYPLAFASLAFRLLEPFLKENVFYSPEDTALRVTETGRNVEPVMRSIEQGQRIVKKGFIITEEDIADLNALRMILPRDDLRGVFATVLFLVLLFGLLCYFSGSRLIGRDLKSRESYLVSGLTALYIAGCVMVKNISIDSIPAAVVVPTALVIILPSILIHSRLALLLAMVLPLGAFRTGSFDTSSYIFAMVSGVVAAYSLQGAEKRMDLVKAGLVIAAANIAAMIAVLLWQRSPAGVYLQALFWAAFNGIASGMLVLGVLPPLEHALNAATTFRLIELSDLNAPILRRLFTAAPGTYSHSIMVANLAEAACQDIGANHLLARVGAYYHDLGKMENAEYFVENQADFNPHDEMAPRLSATVIRSHVKLGVEKARQLGLPGEVIEIIGEHHGNSVISWFYSKALKQEAGDPKKSIVNMEDFTYPGNPPRSRESAVVMLADVSEAAVRTLDKHTAVKMEKYIQELIAAKVEHGQLAQSELTFRDLETIKNAFVRVLVGFYHSRIEYPKQENEQG